MSLHMADGKIRWAVFLQEWDSLNVSLSNGSDVAASSMDIGVLRDYCSQSQVQRFAQLLTEFAHVQPPSEEIETSTSKLIIAVLFVTVGLCGLLGNLITAFVIYLTPSLHSTTNYLLANLAISDFLLICVGVPYDLYYLMFSSNSVMFEGYCQLTSTTISWFTFSSILTIMAISFERLIGICYPLNLKIYFHPLLTVYLILAVWIVAFLPSVFIGLQFKPVVSDFCGNKLQINELVGQCDYVGWSWLRTDYIFELMMVLTFVVPVMFIFICYVKILKTLNAVNTMSRDISVHKASIASRRDSDSAFGGQLPFNCRASGGFKSQKAQRSVIRMLATVTALFFLSYLPYHIERLMAHYWRTECTMCAYLYPIAGILQYVSAAVNPLIYNLMSHRFRKAFKDFCIRKFVKTESFKKSSVCSMPLNTRS
ncbi:unnamed protein product [Bursaphelenchus okinawaensis]|uniref:G-protein coupled receptors family 1 profile domain-containing protein n=1 Tax=Bursaphelenchus okinawaensis TaxID=465554 RepID=A0A811LMI2_9BILA|nr:unnamed protein product [Bursaphelenchus okinawaensis]CAG9124157.1 unnamed protein product [Bursaphelenchus okinawaensis]